MKFAARINSFTREYQNVIDSIKAISAIKEVSYIDLNFPEHFDDIKPKDIKKYIEDSGIIVNGIAVRFRGDFINGSFANAEPKKRNEALDLCFKATDTLLEIGGKNIVIWPENDGFDYAFQSDYERSWGNLADCFKKVSNYNKDVLVSLEYKPFQPRAYSLLSDIGSSLLLAKEVDARNFGLTLDYCHMLMRHENPAFSLSMAMSRNKLFGIHFNDGYGLNDDGLIIGMSSFLQSLEFVYYIKHYGYNGVIYFDTFPLREDAKDETICNVETYKKMNSVIDSVGMNKFQEVIEKNDAIEINKLLLSCLK